MLMLRVELRSRAVLDLPSPLAAAYASFLCWIFIVFVPALGRIDP